MKHKFFVATYGCQMNDYDSKVIESLLVSENYEKASSAEEADILVVNGCAVREHAEKRALGFMSSLKKVKNRKKMMILAGCLANSVRILPKFVDFAVSPTEYRFLPDLIKEKRSKRDLESNGDYTSIKVNQGITLLAPISKGCNNFCSYCIVPFMRGREESFSPESLIGQIKMSMNGSVREILLMGQNVNSYMYRGVDFTHLLSMVLDEFKSLRVRFITSHPKDIHIKLIELMAENKNLCSHLHLPLQSGSNRMLEMMHRQYTYEKFKSIVDEARRIVPSVCVTTDIMTGLPYESDEDFKKTMHAMEELRFDDAFMYRYSARRFTMSRYLEQCDETIALGRLKEMIDLQLKIRREKAQSMLNRSVEVLVENRSARAENEYFGRDLSNRSVIVKSGRVKRGGVYRVKINEVRGITLKGETAEEI
ncbi:MAG: tRNA (N6-isopentenyl adenosine(37)-C2)-methylthiotransferase MiaB [bacterium]|nr:tRNA (N6-isopentenyl adenosine(37)-C2)-methylthiotransferase MiaB [bacterium]